MSALTSYNVAPNPNDSVGGIIPIGSMMMWATSTAPTGWLICNGQAVSRTGYAALFATLGTTYGSGDGSTTFNVPNTAGKVVRGVDGGTYTLAGSGGADSVTLAQNQLPNHSHSITEPNGGLGHRHDINDGAGHNAAAKNQFNNGVAGSNRLSELQGDIPNTQYATTGITINQSLIGVSGQVTQVATNIVNTYLAVNYIIRAL